MSVSSLWRPVLAVTRSPRQLTLLRTFAIASALLLGLHASHQRAHGVEIVVTSGVDTVLPSGSGLNGSDAPHGAAGQNPDGVERWEWDGDDGGGFNLGLLWFDIPAGALDAGVISATLSLHVDNEGDSGEFHRMTTDWLSGPDGGDNVTYNNIPGGPGITAGGNARSDVSFSTGFLNAGSVVDFDVTADVQAWAGGEPNYGWGVLPTAGNGTGITSFESTINPVPTLSITVIPEPSTMLIALFALLGALSIRGRLR